MSNVVRLFRAGATLDSAATNTLGDTTAKVGSSGLIVQSYCTLVAQQPTIDIPSSVASKLPPINDYLILARSNASDYLTRFSPRS